MVGVAGKSKACHECKIRRVKCDFTRPTCKKCARAHLHCSGYGQQVIFINRTPSNPLISATKVLSQYKQSNTKLFSKQNLNHLNQLRLASATYPAPFRSAAFDLLQNVYLPKPRFADGNINTAPFDWVKAVCDLEEPCSLLDHSLLAFCTAQLYVNGAKDVYHEEAAERYHAALRMISSVASWDGEIQFGYILASILVLTTCEMFISPTDDGWRLHVQGVASMLSLKRVPCTMPTDAWISLCSRLRLVSTISQLTNGKRGPITPFQWQTLFPPSRKHDPFDQVIDLASQLPHLFELVSDGVYTIEGAAITDVLDGIFREFRDLQEEHRVKSSVPLYTAVPSSCTNPSDDAYDSKLYPFMFHFRSLQIAGYVVLTWTFQLHIHILLLQMAATGHNTKTSIHDLQQMAHALARHLCQSVEYCHQIGMGAVGPQAMSCAKWVLQRYLEQFGTAREIDWFHNIVNMKGAGMRFSIKLMTFDTSYYSNKSSPLSEIESQT